MPDIIDNVRVGEYIKKLLKERNMTQSDLANQLHISKSAISQNLNGKSTFDIQNLIKIADIFEISLDTLLSLKSDEDRDVISEYERLVRKGIDELKEASSEKLNLDIPDLYGKVFVEYVIEYDKEELFYYLIQNQVNLYVEDHSNAKEVLLKIISYMINKKANGFVQHVYDYVKKYGSFSIDNSTLEKDIIEGLNSYFDQQVIRSLFIDEIKQKVNVLKYFNYNQKLKILSNKDWSRVISKYHCDNLLQILFEVTDITIYIETLIRYSIQFGYKKGLKLIATQLNDDEVFKITHKGEVAQSIINLVSEFNNLELFKMYLNKKIYNDLTKLLIKCIENEKENLFDYILLSKGKEVNFEKLGLYLVSTSKRDLIQRESKQFSQDELDLMFSKTSPNDVELNHLLLENGAKINSRYYNRDTSNKVNKLFEMFLKKGEFKC